jgi:predicted ATP-dependent endonuclease of OLD family
MKNWITDLEIKNFKSLKHVKLKCKRINVLLGKPNVGKSNILEALSLYIAPYCSTSQELLKEYIRYEKLSNLFYEGDRKNQILISSNIGFAAMRYHMSNINSYDIILGPDSNVLNILDEAKDFSLGQQKEVLDSYQSPPELVSKPIKKFYSILNDGQKPQPRPLQYECPIKNYHFKSLTQFTNHYPIFLAPPNGENLYTILESNPKIYEECTHFFTEYGLDLLIDTEYEKIEIQKRVGNRVYKLPYSLTADTLLRIIFHVAAIDTNSNSILLFEEPENHSYPPYISLFGNKVIESKENQFFITTHSPYLLTPFIEECPPEDIAIFIADYENYETKVRALTEKEIENIIEEKIDFFFNTPAFKA